MFLIDFLRYLGIFFLENHLFCLKGQRTRHRRAGASAGERAQAPVHRGASTSAAEAARPEPAGHRPESDSVAAAPAARGLGEGEAHQIPGAKGLMEYNGKIGGFYNFF